MSTVSNSVNSVNSVNIYSAVLPPSPMVFFYSKFLFFVNLFFCPKCSFAILRFHLQLDVVCIIIDNIVNIVNILQLDLLLQLSVVGSLLTGVNGVSAAIFYFVFYFFSNL